MYMLSNDFRLKGISYIKGFLLNNSLKYIVV